MSDYTPTTEEVRDAYCESYADHMFGFKREDFDRWLAEVKAQVWEEGHRSRLRMYENDNFASLQENPYRQRERSGNSNSQPTAETSNLLNKGEI